MPATKYCPLVYYIVWTFYKSIKTHIRKVLPEPCRPKGWHWSQPDISFCCETMDTGLLHHVVCLLMPQLLPVPSFTAWWQRHTAVNNLP